MILLKLLAVLVFFKPIDAWFLSTKNWPVTATGCIKCFGAPVTYVKVCLMDKDPVLDDTMRCGRTRADGCFTLSGSGRDGLRGKPDPYIKIEWSYSGVYGNMEIEGLVLGVNRKSKSSQRSYASSVNFGTLHYNTMHCKAYNEFYKAMKDFRTRTGMALPYRTLHVRTLVLIHGGTPYATLNTVRIPKSYSTSFMTLGTAKHELAHTIRHTMDGNSLHFGFDAARFWYLRTHTCSTVSNYGYAFNEGWAEYWAGTCWGAPYGGSTINHKIEGDVAYALRDLQKKCSSSDGRMVQVLKDNRGRIHSFASFNNYHYSKYKCKI